MQDDAALRRIRARLHRDYPVRPALYWTDLGASAAVAWAAGGVAAVGPVALAPLSIAVAAFAVLRAAYFIHELAHLRGRLGRFELGWNLLVGAWLLLPSFMADAHVDHHRQATYGTAGDPEYEPVATWGRGRIAASIASMLAVPALLVIRFGVIGPVSWLVPAVRRVAWARMSTLQTNASYARTSGDPYDARVVGYELAATLVVGGATAAIAAGAISVRVALAWWAITALAVVVNQARTLIAHGYRGGARRSLSEQVGDSATVEGSRGLDDLVFVLGTRYHALHHLAPQLPYHALAAAHRRVVALGAPAVYGETTSRSMIAGLRARWHEAGIAGHARRHRAASRLSTSASARTR